MSVATSYMRRDPAEIKPWTETCGQIRCLIEECKAHFPFARVAQSTNISSFDISRTWP